MFSSKNYQEAMIGYEEILEKDESFSSAMLLKMAFISEGKGDFAKASFFLTKYYDVNPNPRVITKIKSLTQQTNLVGYDLSDRDRFFKFLTDLREEITAALALLLIISLILLVIFKSKANKPKYYLPTAVLLILVFVSNNFLVGKPRGIVTGSPTLIMDRPTAGGNLIVNVDPGHRVIIKSSKDIWYEIKWGDKIGYVKKENITRL
nr:SH3 domain-containing protein [Rhodonellum psychrophilum]